MLYNFYIFLQISFKKNIYIFFFPYNVNKLYITCKSRNQINQSKIEFSKQKCIVVRLYKRHIRAVLNPKASEGEL